jgi:hypothetical protein
MPKIAIINGSIIEVKPSTALSTSFSKCVATLSNIASNAPDSSPIATI